ncbi:MAG: filamentation induced by cAMP protein Fic [Halothiobacillaceae bacterium]|nr:MAG: filamentation induced by cAMP protein Fic [Halothiobacillaceae bacterium]
MAAKGYHGAFNAVYRTIGAILEGSEPGIVVERDLSQWYQALFAPSVQTGLVNVVDLAGYRNHQVYIRGAAHVPPPQEALIDAMEMLFDCLKNEPEAAVRALLGHFIFVYIHPYMDGNGRIGRFIMNAMLASGGYRWTVIRSDKPQRDRYMAALDIASAKHDIRPFVEFVIAEMAVEWEGM